ncbi:MAG: hypothetical protein GY790_24585, partial [Bacteroidetes bacterium]|nr:hypothetical protein [Bacteroidota bacterium]
MSFGLWSEAMAASTEPKRFVQDRFAIGFWVDPPIGEDAELRYKEIADANFTVVIGGFGARTPEAVKKQITLCEKYNLKAIVSRAELPPEQLPESPAVWGYSIRDEPSASDFPDLRKTVEEVRAARPGRLCYINLYPDIASQKQLGTKTYDEYIKRFIDEVGVPVLSMDHYPGMRPGIDKRMGYLRNLEVMRQYSLEEGIPHWNFFNIMPFGPHFDPTEAQVRWQIYTSLAYGSKGVFYFCYWTPKGSEFPRGGAIITAEGRKTRHYEQVKRINSDLKQLGPTLMSLTSTGVYRVEPEQDPNAVLKDTPIRNLTKGDYLLGFFKQADERQAVLLNNYSFAYTSWPTVEFGVPVEQIREVCKKTGKEIPVVDDSPAMKGLQISLDAGEGRLFLLPRRDKQTGTIG